MLGSEHRTLDFKHGRPYWVVVQSRAFKFGTQRVPRWNPGSATLLHATQYFSPSLTPKSFNGHLPRYTSVLATTGCVRPKPSLDTLCRSGAHGAAQRDIQRAVVTQLRQSPPTLIWLHRTLASLSLMSSGSNTLCPTSSWTCVESLVTSPHS